MRPFISLLTTFEIRCLVNVLIYSVMPSCISTSRQVQINVHLSDSKFASRKSHRVSANCLYREELIPIKLIEPPQTGSTVPGPLPVVHSSAYLKASTLKNYDNLCIVCYCECLYDNVWSRQLIYRQHIIPDTGQNILNMTFACH
jgi:hypothetical protein